MLWCGALRQLRGASSSHVVRPGARHSASSRPVTNASPSCKPPLPSAVSLLGLTAGGTSTGDTPNWKGTYMYAAVLRKLGMAPRCEQFPEPVAGEGEAVVHVRGAALKSVDSSWQAARTTPVRANCPLSVAPAAWGISAMGSGCFSGDADRLMVRWRRKRSCPAPSFFQFRKMSMTKRPRLCRTLVSQHGFLSRTGQD